MNILEKLRQEAKYSMSQVCRSLGMQTASYSRYEKNGFPSEDRIIKLAQLYNVTTDYLLGNTNSILGNYQHLTPKNKTEVISFINYLLYQQNQKKKVV